MRSIVLGLLASVALVAAAGAMMKGDDKPTTPIPSASDPGAALTPRQQAEAWYAEAYDEIARADEALKGENPKSAEKKFKKALDRALRATELDTAYHEAWNVVGYSQRRLGRLDESIAAYTRCLRLRPDYAAAREYLGEAELERGEVEKAREQLAMLVRLEAEGPAATLRAAIEAWEKSHPAAPAAAGSAGSR